MKKNPQFRRGVKAGYFANYDPSELRCNVFSEGVDIGDDLWFRFSPLTHSQRRELIERLRSKKKFRIRFVDLTKVPPQTAAPLSVSWEAEVLGADFISRLHLTAIAAQC